MNEATQTFSFKRLFYDTKDLFAYLLSKWHLIVIVGIAGGLLGILYAYLKKPTYTGELTFVLADGNTPTGLSSLVSQFGIDFNSGGNDVFSQDNVMYLMTSRKMLSRALFKKLPDSSETLINLYIRTEKLDQSWQKDAHLAKAYPFPSTYSTLTPLQDSLFKELYTTISTKVFNVQQPDKKVSLFKVTTTYKNQYFACYLTKYLVDESSAFYIETKTSVARQNLSMLRHEADSLQARLNGSIANSATAIDRTFNLNPSLQVQRVPIQKSQVDVAVTQAAYTEVIKNLEIAKITLEKAFPIYQLLDEPSLPLKQEKPGRLLSCILFGGLAALMIILFFIAKFLLERLDANDKAIANNVSIS